ncbi:TetR/AcrR family transcriptional regulator [Nocardiopsis composta]|uniref:AcrR family transcriptional regulator n=1 Tax=Nocardiopsis composta TaxID=157465 RepID=A0A7W8QQC0_9ACTN|nr:TetR/AcrR family transcriptional regulator [Nocardiopsis composta]MBB5434491.1 AcrR family transcriptional regulator [Nocardiopsis composta]
MPRRNADTRAEIRETALELFAQQGFSDTSLRQIAERLQITKAALYYHFPSKQELLAEVVKPFLEEGEALLAAAEAAPDPSARRFLGDYFDLMNRHRTVLHVLLFDMGAVARLTDIIPTLLTWRERAAKVIFGAELTDERLGLAVFAVGGLQDVAFLPVEPPGTAFRDAAVDAALRVLKV